MHATLGKDMLGANPMDPHGDPPGWERDKGYNRAHLLCARLGGSNYDPRNFVSMHSDANSPVTGHARPAPCPPREVKPGTESR
ncbi:hypothetical protein [Streptomyces sp. MK5]|uniref:hypothetical protein n=1 Tax=unclassified Streptomyces TaxID=2593676 RepID=UPI003556C039